jgi:hypothetical protein
MSTRACQQTWSWRPQLSLLRLGLGVALIGLPSTLFALSTNPPPERIPPLRPPLDLIHPTFWEQHQGKLAAGLALVLLTVGFWLWRRRRPLAALQVAPELAARRALESLRGRPEEPPLVAQVARDLCHYCQAVLRLPGNEWTPQELLAALRRQALPEDVLNSLAQFLQECELRSYSSAPPPAAPALVDRALALVSRVDQLRPSPVPEGTAASGTAATAPGQLAAPAAETATVPRQTP